MKKLLALLLTLALVLPCAALFAPAEAKADQLYIIPGSDTRKLTKDEIREYSYDTLMFAFNEIYSRHGYKFETGSRCYNWFTQMPWYTPNQNENAHDHHETYKQCSATENYNVDLIKEVRREMKESGDLNKHGKGLPTPPSRNLDKFSGFVYLNGVKANQQFEVYSAPSAGAYRSRTAKGKGATVSSNGAIYGMGWENGWLLVMYETNNGAARIGYIQNIKGNIQALPQLQLVRISCNTVSSVSLTDDPAKTGLAMTTLPAGTAVTYLTTMYNSGAWDYIETTIEGKTARGFVPAGSLDIDDADELAAVDAMEQMDEDGDG